jgi:hypothetical protein
MGDSAEEIRRDVQTIGRIDAVPMLLRVISETTGMGFAAVARVHRRHLDGLCGARPHRLSI